MKRNILGGINIHYNAGKQTVDDTKCQRSVQKYFQPTPGENDSYAYQK